MRVGHDRDQVKGERVERQEFSVGHDRDQGKGES